MNIKEYDYFVIGAGSGGVRSARIAASHGAKVGIAEKSDLGGTCVNLGCVPKKLLAYGSDYSMAFEEAEGYGWSVGKADMNWPKLIDRKNNEIKRLNGIYKNLLENAGVDLYSGHAHFVDKHTIEIDGREKIKAKNVLIATGGQPRRMDDTPGGEHAITSDEAFFLKELPKRIAIVGGGYIATEFAHIFHGFGSHVTLMYRGEQLLRGFEDDMSTHLATEMQKHGTDICFNCDIEKIEKTEGGYLVHCTDDKKIECDLVMAAIGRVPCTHDLGLDKTGVETDDQGNIPVNENFQTNISHIHAVGDISSPYQLTPAAIAEGHKLADSLFGKGKITDFTYDNVATAIFSQPPIATVGLTEKQAREKGIEIDVYKSEFKALKHTLSGRDERTLMKLIVDQNTDKVLGCHMIGMDAPEIMQGIAVAMNCGATKTDFDRTIGIHPTAAEEFVTMREAVKA